MRSISLFIDIFLSFSIFISLCLVWYLLLNQGRRYSVRSVSFSLYLSLSLAFKIYLSLFRFKSFSICILYVWSDTQLRQAILIEIFLFISHPPFISLSISISIFIFMHSQISLFMFELSVSNFFLYIFWFSLVFLFFISLSLSQNVHLFFLFIYFSFFLFLFNFFHSLLFVLTIPIQFLRFLFVSLCLFLSLPVFQSNFISFLWKFFREQYEIWQYFIILSSENHLFFCIFQHWEHGEGI